MVKIEKINQENMSIFLSWCANFYNTIPKFIYSSICWNLWPNGLITWQSMELMTNSLAIICDSDLKTHHHKEEKQKQGFVHACISLLTFLTSLFTLPNKIILLQFCQILKHERSWKHHLASCLEEQVWKVFANGGGVSIESSRVPFHGDWSTCGWVHALLSLFHLSTSPSAQCPSTLPSHTQFPDPFPDQCHGPLAGFVDPVLFPKLRQAQPQNKTLSVGPHLISAFPHPPFWLSLSVPLPSSQVPTPTFPVTFPPP